MLHAPKSVNGRGVLEFVRLNLFSFVCLLYLKRLESLWRHSVFVSHCVDRLFYVYTIGPLTYGCRMALKIFTATAKSCLAKVLKGRRTEWRRGIEMTRTSCRKCVWTTLTFRWRHVVTAVRRSPPAGSLLISITYRHSVPTKYFSWQSSQVNDICSMEAMTTS